MILVRPVAVWVLILFLAILNGILRESFLLPRLSLPVAYLISGILLSLFIIAVTLALSRWLMLTSFAHSLSVGVVWLVLTLFFEFGFGRWVQERSWEELLQAYTFKDGNIWPVVLLMTLLAPLIAYCVRYRRKA